MSEGKVSKSIQTLAVSMVAQREQVIARTKQAMAEFDEASMRLIAMAMSDAGVEGNPEEFALKSAGKDIVLVEVDPGGGTERKETNGLDGDG